MSTLRNMRLRFECPLRLRTMLQAHNMPAKYISWSAPSWNTSYGAASNHSLSACVCLCPSQMNSWVDSLQWKPFSASTWLQQAEGHGSKKARTQGGLVQKQEQYDITDQIPEIVKPMGVVEGTSYTVLIIAGLAFAVIVVWAAASELLFSPKEYTCFNMTLKKLQEDPRVTVRLGSPVSGFGQDTRNRQARQRIPNRSFTDHNGVEHIQIQFYARGPNGTGKVSADLYQNASKEWQYSFLFMDMEGPYSQRINLIQQQPAYAFN